MISQAVSFLGCEAACPRLAELEGLVEELEERNERLSQENQQLRKKLDLQKERYARLWKKYRRIVNPHRPPSRKTVWEREEEKARAKGNERKKKGMKGRPGRKLGHEPAWRIRPDPDETIEVTMDECVHCGGELGDPFDKVTRLVTDIPDPEVPKTTEFKLFLYECSHCGEKNEASHPDCPAEGEYGPNTLVQATLFRFEERLPNRKTADLLETLYGLEISHGTVFRLTERVSHYLRPLYEQVRKNLREAEAVHVDETGFRVGGENWWLWSFSNRKHVLYRLADSRGSGVLEEVLGENFDGWIICDGWSSYPAFTSKLQRCWAHLFTEAKEVARRHQEGKTVLKELHGIYDPLNEFVKWGPPPPERKKEKEWAITAMKRLTKKKYTDEEVSGLKKKIENGMEYWFTFVVEPKVDPTNNRAENDLREPIVIRKIIGTLRNRKGTRIFETIMTMLATWKRRDLNPKTEMLKVIRT